ncbi:ribonuclease H-like domain-containing protein [Rhizophagus irregularis DAOM 181602=DAOM 197198]|nr:ribonuclease H-like domain-containing protein [Rhizophagus irregularis DAOM 181602=DAOM 197198]
MTQKRIRHDTINITSPFSWADLDLTVRSYYGRLDTAPDFSLVDVDILPSPSLPPSLGSAAFLAFAASPLATPSDNHYCFYTDGSLINPGTPDVSMGWSWVQVLDDAGFFQSVAAYAHGTIHNWPSSTRAEIAAIHAALTVTPPSSTVTIHTDSQSAIDDFIINWDLTWF